MPELIGEFNSVVQDKVSFSLVTCDNTGRVTTGHSSTETENQISIDVHVNNPRHEKRQPRIAVEFQASVGNTQRIP